MQNQLVSIALITNTVIGLVAIVQIQTLHISQNQCEEKKDVLGLDHQRRGRRNYILYVVIIMNSLVDYYMTLFGVFDSWEQCLGKIFKEIISNNEQHNQKCMIDFERYDDYSDITVSYDGLEEDIYRIFTKEE